jgi:magnesium-transporting ATPase (P-type)
MQETMTERPLGAHGKVAPAASAGDAAWHAASVAQALQDLRGDRHGLTQGEAAARLARYGPNRLPPPRRRAAWQRLLLQFHNVIIYVLLAAGAITALLGHGVDSGVIFCVVLINAAIGFVQEGKAESAIAAIRQMLSLTAHVLRDRRRVTIPAEELVPGDVVLLESGDKVPADLRLLEVKNLRVEEAALTGESEPVEKTPDPVDDGAALGDRACMVFAGTLVTFGQARGVVVATGLRTEIGRISRMLEEVQEVATPLLAKIGVFGRWLTGAILAFSAATFAFGVWVRAYTPAEMFLAVAGIAVAAIPEGLPAIMTITLAIGVQRMARRNAIIRRLPAVETLGSVTVICSDKTGTLTRNEMTVQRVVTSGRAIEVAGVGYAPEGGFAVGDLDLDPVQDPALLELARAALLCNDASVRREGEQWRLDGDPTEGALHVLGLKAGLDPRLEAERLPRTDVIPFESEHRFMATLHHDHAGHGVILLKGAPERVLDLAERELRDGSDAPLDREWWEHAIEDCARNGQRVLAIALKPAAAGQRSLAYADAQGGYTLLGLTGMIDPPREEAIAAVQRCRAAGIRVKMITGDHAATAAAVARQLGVSGHALTGQALDWLDDAALAQAVREADVFARASPEHKLRLVRALQSNGEVVAMTGDGVNDSPALKRADVGVAMGMKGTEAAKDASDMVIADDNFASIAHAVEEGRTVYDNIKKFLVFMLPTNGGEAGILVAAILAGLTLPITAVQILWVNMITAVTLGLAIAFDPAEPGVMARPPRPPREALLTGFLVWRILLVTALLTAAGVGLFVWESGRGESVEAARTLAVNILVVGELVYLFNSRHLIASSLGLHALSENRLALLAAGLLVPLQLAFTYLPVMQRLFGSAPLDLDAWARVLAFGAGLFLVIELEKAVQRWRGGPPAPNLPSSADAGSA